MYDVCDIIAWSVMYVLYICTHERLIYLIIILLSFKIKRAGRRAGDVAARPPGAQQVRRTAVVIM